MSVRLGGADTRKIVLKHLQDVFNSNMKDMLDKI